MRPVARDGLTAFGVAAGYAACVTVASLLNVPPDTAAIIWPARAFLIAVLLVLAPRLWWTVALAVPVHLTVVAIARPDLAAAAAAIQVLGHVAVAFATVLAVRRLIPRARPFESVASLALYILIAGLAVPAVLNVPILYAQISTGLVDDLWQSWRHWMSAGFFPTIAIPPLLVLVLQGRLTGRSRTPVALQLEIAAVSVALFAVAFVAFGEFVDPEQWPAAYLAPLPLLLWATARFGVGGTALSLLAMASGLVAQTLLQHGPFAAASPTDQVVSLQVFLAATSAPLLLFAALMDERRGSATLLRLSEERLQFAASATETALWQWEPDPPQLWLTDNCRELFGLPEDATSTPLAFLDAVHPEDQAMVGEALGAVLRSGEPQPALEFRLRSRGRTRWFILQMRAECDEVRKPAIVSGVFRDVTDRAEARREVAQMHARLASLRDDERRRIAEELHDSTAQHLVAAKLNLLNLRQRLPEELQPLLDEARHSLQEATAEIRTFTYLLHPSQLDEDDLATMLRRYVPGFERRTGIATTVRVDERADLLPADLRHALLRITQESLGNVQRHARATRASVDVRCFGGNVHLVVRDNGRGIAAHAGVQLGERLRLGHGIPAMTARVRRLGGSVDVETRASGTTVHVSIPLDRARGGSPTTWGGSLPEDRRDQAHAR